MRRLPVTQKWDMTFADSKEGKYCKCAPITSNSQALFLSTSMQCKDKKYSMNKFTKSVINKTALEKVLN